MPRQRVLGLVIAAAGIGFCVLISVGDWLRLGQPFLSPDYRPAPTIADALPSLSSTSLMAFAAAGLLVLLFSRTVPRWWSLAYAALALGLLVAIISWQADIAAQLFQRIQLDQHDALFTVRAPRAADYVVIASRLALGVVASLAIAAPLILPPRLSAGRPISQPSRSDSRSRPSLPLLCVGSATPDRRGSRIARRKTPSSARGGCSLSDP